MRDTTKTIEELQGVEETCFVAHDGTVFSSGVGALTYNLINYLDTEFEGSEAERKEFLINVLSTHYFNY